MNMPSLVAVPTPAPSADGPATDSNPTELVNITIAPPKASLKLDLACGQRPQQGFDGVDHRAPQAKYKVDLMKFPWPWPDNSVAELHCSHFVEHLPARELEERDIKKSGDLHDPAILDRFLGQDFLFAFFDECYRILAPDAWMTVVCPAMPSDRAFQDPTHRRFLTEATFHYLNRLWRVGQRLDHYQVACDFEAQVGFSHDPIYNTYHPEAASQKLRELYNQRVDWIVKLKAMKGRIIMTDIHGNAIASPPNATRFLRFDDEQPGTPFPHPCAYVFEVAGREERVPFVWPPAPKSE